MEIDNKHVYITGSNRGIGFAFACEAAKRGAHLYLVNRSSITEQEVSALKNKGAKSVSQIKLNLFSREDIADFLASLVETKVDIFINNAGLLTGGLLEEQNLTDIMNTYQVNLCAVTQICHGLLPIMLKQKSGYIVNNASVSGKMFFPCASTYAATKAGVVALTQCLEQELRTTDVKTLLLLTPGIKTQMYDDISTLYSKNLKLDLLSSIPASEWANRVFDAIESERSMCWPQGFSRFSVWFAHHFPYLLSLLAQSKFKR